MTRLNILLVSILVLCSIGLVTSQHRARKLFIELERAQTKTRQLEVNWNQLQIDLTGLATASRIDSKARKSLSMQPIAPQRTLYLTMEPPVEKTAMGTAR